MKGEQKEATKAEKNNPPYIEVIISKCELTPNLKIASEQLKV